MNSQGEPKCLSSDVNILNMFIILWYLSHFLIISLLFTLIVCQKYPLRISLCTTDHAPTWLPQIPSCIYFMKYLTSLKFRHLKYGIKNYLLYSRPSMRVNQVALTFNFLFSYFPSGSTHVYKYSHIGCSQVDSSLT